ncbi:hypothetical protein F4U94_16970 [Sphingobium limneticum]|uniref:DUF6894 family protein n=1 Tax=Sphingobium limneticum TaxID=1007511 RepID=UPI00123D7C4E|nr:hypothetical protein [Sphingobium limneticum]KAA9012999.1 hypothetical protein F4U94_16970 [Sphingobium limneticum]
MPHYHLNLYHGGQEIDIDGTEFADRSDAMREAVRGGRAVMAEQLLAGEPIHLHDRIEIADADGKVVEVVSFRDLITIKDDQPASD